ncbi:Protein phosphatase 2C [Desulfopila aestuarii DSM 18488]|uniref:Protein phosphatase 2C n=1 Tax=Desulfopila aestuarii DSM 18488 TaxID=1121416 RepID=A0A1M7Y411_9BACT|nr:Protein phosphatase 2C [Desulfopila aestuarii DSM 18488]
MYLSNEQRTFASLNRPLYRYTVKSLLEKGSGEINEDVLLEEGSLLGVFDGATSLDKRRFQNGLTGGLLAAKTAAQSFVNNCGSLDQLAKEANRTIHKVQIRENICMDERHKLWSTSLAVVHVDGNQLEYCQTGDALILFIFQDGGYKVITPDIDIDRDTLQLWKEMQLAPDALIHEVLAEQIRKIRLEMNISYGVLNGEPEALNFLRHGYEDLTDVSDILLFTDGLHLPRENPKEEHDWQTFVELYRLGGLQAVRDHVRHLQQQDPACRKYPRFKLHDDIAAVAISR